MVTFQRITTCLWFNGQAEEAANHYLSIFKNSKITGMARYGDIGPGPIGTVMTVAFELDGHAFLGLNGGPKFPFSEAISMIVDCADQAEVDYYWDRLCDGGKPVQCSWIKDRFGVSWQVVSKEMVEMLTDSDFEKSQRVFAAVRTMVKPDIAAARAAFEGAHT